MLSWIKTDFHHYCCLKKIQARINVITAKLADRSGLISVFIKQEGQKLTVIIVFNMLRKHDVKIIREHCFKISFKMPHR